MKTFFKKHWPSIAHAAGIGVLFLNPSVQAFVVSHPAIAAPVGLAWGIALHWAQSPRKSSGSQF